MAARNTIPHESSRGLKSLLLRLGAAVLGSLIAAAGVLSMPSAAQADQSDAQLFQYTDSRGAGIDTSWHEKFLADPRLEPITLPGDDTPRGYYSPAVGVVGYNVYGLPSANRFPTLDDLAADRSRKLMIADVGIPGCSSDVFAVDHDKTRVKNIYSLFGQTTDPVRVAAVDRALATIMQASVTDPSVDLLAGRELPADHSAEVLALTDHFLTHSYPGVSRLDADVDISAVQVNVAEDRASFVIEDLFASTLMWMSGEQADNPSITYVSGAQRAMVEGLEMKLSITGPGVFEDSGTDTLVVRNSAKDGPLPVKVLSTGKGDVTVSAAVLNDLMGPSRMDSFAVTPCQGFDSLVLAIPVKTPPTEVTRVPVEPLPDDPTPPVTPNVLAVVTKADAQVNVGDYAYDTATVIGEVPGGAYLLFDVYTWDEQSERPAEALHRGAERVPVPGPGEYRSPGYKFSQAGNYQWFATLYSADGAVLAEDQWGASPERTIVVQPINPEPPADEPLSSERPSTDRGSSNPQSAVLASTGSDMTWMIGFIAAAILSISVLGCLRTPDLDEL